MDWMEQTGNERFVDAPPEPERQIALALIRSAESIDDQRSLEKMLEASVRLGWDDLANAILAPSSSAAFSRLGDRHSSIG